MSEFEMGVVARVESIPLASLAPFALLRGCSARDFVRSRQVEGERQVNGLSPSLRYGDAPQFESLLAESFGGVS